MDVWKEYEHNEITHSAAHHLMAIDDLVEKLGYARVSDVARRLNITRGSVSISLQPLKKAGLINQDENRHLQLSEVGRQLVHAIKTKRLLLQRLFHEVLGVEPRQAEIDACKLEHLISNETANRLVSFLRFVDSDESRARELLRLWAEFDPSCAHEPGRCPSCETHCMEETVPLPPRAPADRAPPGRRPEVSRK